MNPERRRRRRLIPRRRAAEALAAGGCMFGPLGGCDGETVPQTLTWDSLVLVGDAHLPHLLELRHDLAETRRLRRYLSHRFRSTAA